MSDELRLPDHLAACEARLAALAPPAAGVDRDELLYRAGWAAGAEEARRATLSAPPVTGVGRTGIAAWSMASAALAASIAVAVTLSWRPAQGPQVVDHAPPTNLPVAATVSRPAAPSRAAVPAMKLARTDRATSSGLLGLRQRALAGGWTEPSRVALSTADVQAPAPVTARQLMHELLPSEAARPHATWPWRNTLSGDSI